MPLTLDMLVEHFKEGWHLFYSETRMPFAAFHQGPCLHFHVSTIERLRELRSTRRIGYADICRDGEYLTFLYATLTAWGMNSLRGGPKLQDFDVFSEGLQGAEFTDCLDSLSCYVLQEIGDLADVHAEVGRAYQWLASFEPRFGGNRIMRTSRAVVAASKVLHHLLPDLLMPVDGTYTAPLLSHLGDGRFAPAKNGQTFDTYWKCIKVSHHLARHAPLPGEVAPTPEYPMNTSVAKLVDNAIIGMSVLFPEAPAGD